MPDDVTAIQNVHQDFSTINKSTLVSAGLHPWYITPTWEQGFTALTEIAIQPQVAAIGECGLDWACNTDRNLQEAAFLAQITLANRTQKPLMIHCVRAYGRLTALLERQAQVPVIIHGFNKHPQLAQQLVARGYFLSFGAALLRPESPASQAITTIDQKHLFLETDNSGLSIHTIYERAALLLGCSQTSLANQIHHNYTNCFKHDKR